MRGRTYGLAITFTVTRGIVIVFKCTGGLAIAFAVVRGFEVVSACVVSLTLASASVCVFAIASANPQSRYRMCGRADGITIAQAIPSQYPTFLPKKSPTNNKPLYLQEVIQIPTSGIYAKHYSLTITRDIMIPHKVTTLWKFLKFVEICGTLDPKGALRSNISGHGFFSSLMTQVWHLHLQTKASIMRECENISGTSGILYFWFRHDFKYWKTCSLE